jgi:hypothetical protein
MNAMHIALPDLHTYIGGSKRGNHMRKSVSVLAALTAAATSCFAAPSTSEILSANKAATGGSAWDSKAIMSGNADFTAYGLTGKVHQITDLKGGRSEVDVQFGPATQANGFDGVAPWQKDTSGTVTQQQGGDALVLAVNDAYRSANKWWLADYGGAAVTSQGAKTDSGGRYDVLTFTPKGGKAFDVWYDVNTHLAVKFVEQQGSQPVVTTLSDYRPESGVVVPHKLVVDTGVGAKYLQTITVTKVEFLGPQPDTIFAAPKVTVTDFSIAGGAAATTLPIQIVNNHIYGEVKVNGKGPFLFIFDTGGHNIITPPLAKEMGLKVEGSLPGSGAGEGVMEGGLTNGVNLDVGDASVKNQLFIVFPFDSFSDIEGIPMPGMVGYETFRRFVTRIDYGAKTLTLIDAKHFDPKDAGTPVKFTFNEHVPEVMGTFEGIPAKFDIDTGSRSELTITKPFAEKNNIRTTHPKGVEATDGWGVGGPSHAYVARGADMTLGDVKVGPIVASLSTDAKGAFSGNDYSGNVGAGILKRFVVTFDYGNQVMYLKPLPAPVADTGTYDRAGMWINVSGNGFKVVALTKGAPAEEAGLKTDDLIVAVDGKASDGIHLYNLRKRLRNDPPGTVVRFKILRDKKYHTLKVTLRDLI